MDKPVLSVRVIDSPSTPGGKALALCWPDGEIVGKQLEAGFEFSTGDYGVATVKLYIDGKTLIVNS